MRHAHLEQWQEDKVDRDESRRYTEDCELRFLNAKAPELPEVDISDEEYDEMDKEEAAFRASLRARIEAGETAREIIDSFGGAFVREVYEVADEVKWEITIADNKARSNWNK